MSSNEGVRFREVQKSADRSLLVSAGILLAIMLVIALVAVVVDRMWLILWEWLVIAGLWVYISLLELTVEVRGDGLYVRFRPHLWRFREVPLDGVAGCEEQEWGRWYAWRIRGFPYGGGKRAKYVAKGRRGVRIDYDGGNYVLIGSERPEELAEAIRGLIKEKG